MALIIGFHDWRAPAESNAVTAFVDGLISVLDMQLPDVALSVDSQQRRFRASGGVTELVTAEVLKPGFGLTLYNEGLQDDRHELVFSDHYIELIDRPREKCFFLYCKTSSVAGLMAAVFLDFEGWSALRGGYGYALDWKERDHKTPLGFVSGTAMLSEDLSDEELDRAISEDDPVGRWGDILWSGKKPHLDGRFRDVYPLNFVTEAHLTNQIGGRSLLEHIRISPLVLGEVTRLAEGCYIWQVPERDLDEVKGFLDSAGLLLAPEPSGFVS